jgi:hypothetical protein
VVGHRKPEYRFVAHQRESSVESSVESRLPALAGILTARCPDPWCSGPTCQPVTLEIAGSNPVGSASFVTSLRL